MNNIYVLAIPISICVLATLGFFFLIVSHVEEGTVRIKLKAPYVEFDAEADKRNFDDNESKTELLRNETSNH